MAIPAKGLDGIIALNNVKHGLLHKLMTSSAAT
jgi:hypothetical protein